MDKDNYFYVQPKFFEKLKETLETKGFYTLVAPSQSGKTTLCCEVMSKIKNESNFSTKL